MTRPARNVVGVEQHPDIVALRARYDLAGAKPGAQVVDGLILLSGLFLAISPWIVDFTGDERLMFNNLFTGIAVALLAVGFSSAYGHIHGIAWCVPVIGVWTIIAPWVIHGWDTADMTNPEWSNLLTGAAITLFGLATMSVAMTAARTTTRRRTAPPPETRP